MTQKPVESDLPRLLAGSEITKADPDEGREANLLGRAIAILVKAKKERLEPGCKGTFLNPFRQECDKSIQYIRRRNKFLARGSPNPLFGCGRRGPEARIEYVWKWLSDSLSGQPDWNALWELIEMPLLEHQYDMVDQGWWHAIRQVARRACMTQEDYDPIEEIVKISEEYQGKQRQRATDGVDHLAARKAGENPNGKEHTSANGGAHVNVSIQNSDVTMGDVSHKQNLATGNGNSIGRQTPTSLKKKKDIKRTITASVLFFAALLTVLQILFGWMGEIWRFLTSK
jgi:hypothetical protein